MVDKDETSDGSVEETTSPVVPSESSDDRWEHETHDGNQRQVELVLELDHWVTAQVGDVGDTWLASWLDNHPAQVRPDQTVVSTVWVEIGVSVPVVSTVTSSPPVDGSLNGTGSHESQEVLEWTRSRVSSVCPKTMVTSSDTKTGEEVVDDCPCERLPLQRSGEHSVEGKKRGSCKDGERDPLNLAENILPLDGR